MSHLTNDRPEAGGLWVSDEFLWDVMPRLSPLAVYVYLAVGRHPSRFQYPTPRELALETLRGEKVVRDALAQLGRTGLLNAHDLKMILRPDSFGE